MHWWLASILYCLLYKLGMDAMGEMNRNNMDKENEKYMGYQD